MSLDSLDPDSIEKIKAKIGNKINLQDLNFNFPSFFSEKDIDSWMKEKHAFLMRLRKVLMQTIGPIIIVSAAFIVLITWFVSDWQGAFTGALTGTFVSILAFIMIYTIAHDKLLYYMIARHRERKGMWFGAFQCKCKKPRIKALDSREVANCNSSDDSGKFSKCPSCNPKTRLMDCDECKQSGSNHERCRVCATDFYLKEMWLKKI